MIKTESMKIPADKRIRTYGKYVYLKKNSTWDPDKKHSTDDRVMIGKTDEKRKGYFHPSNAYFEYFANQQKALAEPGSIDTYLAVGQYLALRQSMKKCGAMEALKKTFPKLYQNILAFALFMVDSQQARAQKYARWGFSNFAGIDHVLSSAGVSNLFSSISDSDVDSFEKKYAQCYSESGISSKKLIIAMDSTNVNTNSNNIKYAEFGHAKKKENLPDIATAMGVDEETGIPLYYEDFLGSLLDKTQLKHTNEKLKEFGFADVFFVFDRGYYNKNNLSDVMESNKFAILVPDTVTTSFDYIRKYGFIIRNNEMYYMDDVKAYGISLESGLFLGKHLYTYIYFDPDKALNDIETLHAKLRNITEKLGKQEYDVSFAKQAHAFLMLSQAEDGGYSIEKNIPEIQEEIDFAGFFMAVSNEKVEPAEMLKRLRRRDRAEKTFLQMKSFLDSEKSYCHRSETFRGRNFVLFIALIAKLAFRHLQSSLIKYDPDFANDTTSTLLAETAKLTVYKNSNGNYIQKYALTSKMKKVFGNVDIHQAEITKFLSEEIVKSV